MSRSKDGSEGLSFQNCWWSNPPINSIIEQNNFTNESLHVIGQQLDRIEEKIIEKTVSIEKPISEKYVSVKTEKRLIDLPSQREKVNFKTS